MSTKAIIKYPVENSLLFSNELTIHYTLSSFTDPSVFGIVFVLDGVSYTDTALNGTYTINNIKESSHILSGYLINKRSLKIENTDFNINFNSFDTSFEVKNKITYVLKSTIPDFVKDDYPNFIMFLKAYYEWLYSSNNPFYAPLLSEDYKDIDRTPDFFVDYFRKQYLVNFPESLTKDKQTGTPLDIKTLIKNINDFYSAKGTERSITFLLKILYDSYSEIYYPKRDIFKPSDSKWQKIKTLKFNYSANNIYDISSKRLYQEISGYITYRANIENIKVYNDDNQQIVEIQVSHEEGIIDYNNTFKVNTNSEIVTLSALRVNNKLNVLNGGLNYKLNDRIVVLDPITEKPNTIAKVTEVNEYGGIVDTQIIKFGIFNNLNYSSFSVNSKNGSDASFTISNGFECEYDGFWTDKNSHTNSIKKIADNKRYQDFSYVVRTDRMLEKYVDVLKKLAHPAGMEVLGDVLIKTNLNEEVLIDSILKEIYTPLIGNYIAFRINTDINIRDQTNDLFPFGFDPTQPIPLQDGTDEEVHQPGTDGSLNDDLLETTFKYIPDVSDSEFVDQYWVVYPHPNTEINNYTDLIAFSDIIIKDFVKQEK